MYKFKKLLSITAVLITVVILFIAFAYKYIDSKLGENEGREQAEKISGYQQIACESLFKDLLILSTPDFHNDPKVNARFEKCLHVGMNDFIAKPFKMDALKLILEKYLREEKKAVTLS